MTMEQLEKGKELQEKIEDMKDSINDLEDLSDVLNPITSIMITNIETGYKSRADFSKEDGEEILKLILCKYEAMLASYVEELRLL